MLERGFEAQVGYTDRPWNQETAPDPTTPAQSLQVAQIAATALEAS